MQSGEPIITNAFSRPAARSPLSFPTLINAPFGQPDTRPSSRHQFSSLLYFVVVRSVILRHITVREQTTQQTTVRNPHILSGEPIIERTRIPVRAIVLYHYSCGDIPGVLTALSSLSSADVETALQFYRGHREEINTYIAENNVGEGIPYDEL